MAYDGLEDSLDEPAEFEIVDTPLQDVVEFLSNQHKIVIRLDPESLKKAGIAVDQPVNRVLSRVTLRSALNLTLEQAGLDFRTEKDAIVIVATTKGAGRKRQASAEQEKRTKSIHASLEEPIDAELTDAPLDEVLQFLSDVSDIPIIPDERVWKRAGIKTDQETTLSSANAPLGTALSRFHSKRKLKTVIRDEVIFVTPSTP